MMGRDSDFDAGGVGLRPPVGDATGGLVRPLGAFERMFHLSEQKSTKHFCVVAELADDLEASWIFFGALSGPRSRGRILLTGPDPDDRVRIDANALSDPEDLESAKTCIEFMREIGSAAVLQPHIKREVMPGDLTGTDLEAYIRDAASTYWHQVGTAKMGNDSTFGGRRPSQGLWSREPSSRRRLHHAADNDGQHHGAVRSDRRTSSGTAHQRAPAVTAA
jgi:choline dehydrogenase-like flavoprotein